MLYTRRLRYTNAEHSFLTLGETKDYVSAFEQKLETLKSENISMYSQAFEAALVSVCLHFCIIVTTQGDTK